MDKIIEKSQVRQMAAGIYPDDSNIEFVGIRKTKNVLWIQNGQTHFFKDLPKRLFEKIKKNYLSDSVAIDDLQGYGSIERQVELYTYYMYGDLDEHPDIENGRLAESENYRHEKNCICQNWKSKQFKIDGNTLNSRDMTILDCISDDLPDKATASILGISVSTFNWHKQNLLQKTNCTTKVALALKAHQQKALIV